MPTIHCGTVRPYQRLTERRDAAVRPALGVRVIHGQQATPTFPALVDSGADASTFHVVVASFIGIDLDRCRQEAAQDLGGSATTYACPVLLEVEGRRFAAEVHFVTTIPPTLALLGRRNVFRQFQFGFDERASEPLIEPCV